jgi:ribosomal protein L7/L12
LYLIAVLAFSILASIPWQVSASSAAVSKRLRRVEQKLDLILEHLGVDASQIGTGYEPSEDVRRLADAGQKIQAIQLLRKETGWGLKEAKDAVEEYLSGK